MVADNHQAGLAFLGRFLEERMRRLVLILPFASLVNPGHSVHAQYYPYAPPGYYAPGYYPPPNYYRPPPPQYYSPPPSQAPYYYGAPPSYSSANCGTPDQFKPCNR
jgi:hypothetical protein